MNRDERGAFWAVAIRSALRVLGPILRPWAEWSLRRRAKRWAESRADLERRYGPGGEWEKPRRDVDE